MLSVLLPARRRALRRDLLMMGTILPPGPAPLPDEFLDGLRGRMSAAKRAAETEQINDRITVAIIEAYRSGWQTRGQLAKRARNPQAHVQDLDPKRAYDRGLAKVLKRGVR
jgi:hypothetical protein